MNLKDFIKTYFLKEGDYTLSSGKKSNLYFDIKGLMLNSDGARMVGKEFEKLLGGHKNQKGCLIGMELGGALLTQIMIYRGFYGVVMRKKQKEYGLAKRIEGWMSKPYIIIEDVITTGNTVEEMRNLLAPHYKEEVCDKIFCIIDRTEDGKRYTSLFKERDFS